MPVPAYHSIQLPFCGKHVIKIASSNLQLSHSSRVGNSTSQSRAFNFPVTTGLVIQLPIHPFNRSVAFHSQCDHSIDRVQLPIRPFNMFSLSTPIPQVPLQSGVKLNGTRVPTCQSMVLIDRAEVLYLPAAEVFSATIQPIGCMFGLKPLWLGPKVEC